MWFWGDTFGWWWAGMGLMMLWMVIFWGGIIALVVWGISRLTRPRGPEPGITTRQDPLDIARERYAKGEITKEQFEQIRRDLS